MNYVYFGAAALGVLAFLTTFVALFLRRVVPTNEVHIVQQSKKTISYGQDTKNGNIYYQWPSYLPLFGISRTILPVSVFVLDLEDYEAYDQGRLPFVIDVKAFFRIDNSTVAATRVSSFAELNNQLRAIVQGAIRAILASNDIETILQGRSTFGEQFTKEVETQLSNWGVAAVKNIELMDIRDHKESQVIMNIMAKKKSHIEMESRTEVAKNKQLASIAEINAQKEIDMQAQNAKQSVGLQTTQSEQAVALAQQTKQQAVNDAAKVTKDKEMNVLSVASVRQAEIDKQVQIVKADQTKQVQITQAEGNKQTLTLNAEGALEAKRRESEGITLEGTARAEAEKALQLAPVQAQITLAKEIGANKEYQEYLVTIRKVEAAQAVGVKQAEALAHADVKVISNSGTPSEGLTGVMDLFSSKGGTQVGAMLEALSNTDQGKAFLNKAFPTPAVPPTVTNGSGKTLMNGKSN